MFTNGQKVVCIDDKFPAWLKKLYAQLPIEGNTYVIRGSTGGVSYRDGVRQEGEIAVYLVGISNPTSDAPPYRERGFNADRFRPLEETTTETEAQTRETVNA